LIQEKPTYEMLEKKIKTLESSANLISVLKAEAKLNHLFLDMLFDTIPNPIFYKDKTGIYQHCNDAFSKIILGIPKDEIIGKTLYELPYAIPKKNADKYYKKDQELFTNPGTQNYEGKVQCADGVVRYYNFYKSTFISDEGEALGIVGVMLDVSEHKIMLKELEEKNEILNDMSITDSLTKLYNRRHFEQVLKEKVSLLDRHKQIFACMLIDIDFFKNYNDTFGHHMGDIALKNISDVLQKSLLRPSDYAFRVGGEEFCLLYNVNEIDRAVKFAEKLIKIVEDVRIKSALTETSQFVTISAGLVILKNISCEESYVRKIYDEADKLLYVSKKNGRNQLTLRV